MGIHYNSRIVTDGLIFYMDMDNPRSNVGEPTTNLITNPIPDGTTTGFSRSGGTGGVGVSYSQKYKAIRWENIGYATWGSYLNIYPSFVGTLDTESQYTISYEWRSDTPQHNPALRSGLVQGDGQSPAITDILTLSGSVDLGNGWYRFERTFTPLNAGVGAAYNRLIIAKRVSPSIFYIRNIQFEKKPQRTRFTVGERPVEDSFKNLVNPQTIITPNDITYLNDTEYEFNGNTSFLSIGDDPLPIFDKSNTVEFWLTAYSDRRGILLGDYGIVSTTNSVGFELHTSRRLRIWWAGNDTFSGNDAFETGKPQLITFVRDKESSELRFYVNGELVHTRSVSLSDLTITANHRIGRDNRTGATAFHGKIYQTKIYTKALSESQIKQNYHAHKGRYLV